MASGTGEVGAGFDLSGRKVVPPDVSAELHDEQRGDPEQRHTPRRRKNTNGSTAENENSAAAPETLTSGIPSLTPPLASLSHRSCKGTSKLSS